MPERYREERRVSLVQPVRRNDEAEVGCTTSQPNHWAAARIIRQRGFIGQSPTELKTSALPATSRAPVLSRATAVA